MDTTKATKITHLFLDIGGVLLTNGWDHFMRQRAAQAFNLNYEEMNERHHLTFDTYEEGKLAIDEYLDRVVFYKSRSFSHQDFKDFMYAQSEPHQEMIDLVCRLKARYRLEIAAISNEGRELTVYRIRKFNLKSFMDFFISSCFVHYRKPDADIYRIALDIAQAIPEQSIYIEDRPMFVDIASSMGFHSIQHNGVEFTRAALAAYGLDDTLESPV
jgi:putative hydrolase of the HAD superfamily